MSATPSREEPLKVLLPRKIMLSREQTIGSKPKENKVRNDFSIDGLIEVLAQRVAFKVTSELDHTERGSAIQPRLLTIPQAGEYLSRSPAAVRHLINVGKLPAVRIDGRVFLDIRDLERAVEECKQFAR